MEIKLEKRYLYAGDVYNALVEKAGFPLEIASDFLGGIKRAEVAEVVHGEWMKQTPNPEAMRGFHEIGMGKHMTEKSVFWTCSVCGMWGTPSHKYCPSCGAKMDGGKSDGNA